MKNIFKIIMLSIAIPLAFSSCSKKNDAVKPVPETFVLVHGAWQAPWVWDDVKAGLEKNGKTVIVVQLPAHGSDMTPPGSVSLNSYRDVVVSAINGTPGKVILVGHSLAGMVISAVAEEIPNKIDKLVYLAAYLPASGQSMLQLAQTDADSQLGPALIFSADQLSIDVQHDQIIPLFCPDCSVANQNELLANYRSEPSIPFLDTVHLTAKNFGAAHKFYIHTLQDHVVGIALQNQMAAKEGVIKNYSINCSHSAFLAKPDSVISILTQISTQ